MLLTRTRKVSFDLDPSITSLQSAGGQPLRRAMTIGAIDEDKRTIELAFSSDAEIERWGDIEILDHSPGAVDLSRLNGGASLLFNHDMDDVVGVVESARIDPDRKGRAFVRFGKGSRAEEVWQDVKDGILRNVSVGYRIRSMEMTEKRDAGQYVYTVTGWEPFEISIVTVPVDTSVGVQRNLDPKHKSQIRNIMNREQIIAALRSAGITFAESASDSELAALLTRSLQPTPAPAPAPAPRMTVNEPPAPSADDERTRARSIRDAGKKFKMQEIAEKAIDEGKTIDEFRAIALEEFDKRAVSLKDSHSGIGMSDKEVRSFSFLKLISALSEPQSRSLQEAAKFELEVCQAASSKTTRNVRGILIPSDVLTRDLYGRRGTDIISVKTASGYTGTVGATVNTTLLTSSFVEMLRNRTLLMQLGTVLTGLSGNIDIPKQTGQAAANWIGEDDEAPKTDVDFGLLSMTPHTVAAYSQITRRSLIQSSLDMEAFVRMELAKAVAQVIDRDGFYGDGTGNAPVGILESNPNTVDFAGVNPTFAELVAMETELADVNIDPSSARYIARATFRGYAKTALKFASAGSATIWEPGNTVNGYGAEITNQIVAGDVFFGEFSEFLIGLWGGLDILVDPYTDSKRGRINVVAMQDVDFETRRPEAFTYGVKPAGS